MLESGPVCVDVSLKYGDSPQKSARIQTKCVQTLTYGVELVKVEHNVRRKHKTLKSNYYLLLWNR